MVCGTLMIDGASKRKRMATPAEVLVDRLTSSVYEKARQNDVLIDGFPDFGPLLSEISNIGSDSANSASTQSFKVTTLHPSGSLIIQEQFLQQFDENQEFEELVENHNKTYNQENLRIVDKNQAVPAAAASESVKVEIMEPENGKELTAESLAALPNALDPQNTLSPWAWITIWFDILIEKVASLPVLPNDTGNQMGI